MIDNMNIVRWALPVLAGRAFFDRAGSWEE